MKIDNRKILIAIIALTLLILIIVPFTFGVVRISLALLFTLFVPGYTLLSALFPKVNHLDGIQRIALSFGLSIGVTIFIGLILNYTPVGINLYPVLISVALFVLTTSAIGWHRQSLIPPSERFSITINVTWAKLRELPNTDKALYISLLIVLLTAVVTLGYVTATPKEGDVFTEIYLLNKEGQADNYPKQVELGEPLELVVGIINHEYETASYRVDIRINGDLNQQIVVKLLPHEKKWEELVGFIPRSSGMGQKVEFLVYKNGQIEPYFKDPLHLYIDVN